MKRISVQLDDATAAAVEQAGGSSASAWIAGVVRQRVIEDAAAAAGAYDAATDDPQWEAERLAGAA